MAILSDADREAAMRRFVARLFVEPNNTAILTSTDVKAAVVAIDNWIDGAAVQTTINAQFPEPFKSTATGAQKAAVLAVVAAHRAGLI